jgi:hypothetical protein
MMTATDRVDLLTVARDLASTLDLPPIGSINPVYGLTPPGTGCTWLELATRPGLAEALVLAMTEYLATLPAQPKVIYLTQSGLSCEPGYYGHRSHTVGWYDLGLARQGGDREPSLIDRAMRLNDRLLAAPGMSE